MIKSLKQQAYSLVEGLTLGELAVGAGIALFFAYFFYRSVWAVPFMLPIGGLYLWWNRRKKEQKAKQFFLEQFKECILSVAASLKAGYAVENAFVESIGDMQMMFGENSEMVEQLYRIQKGLQNNETLESLLFSLAKTSGEEDVLEFAEVFSIAKRNSGNIPETIAVYSSIIAGKLDMAEEIHTLLAAKRLEQQVMNIMPFVIVLYLEYTNPGYFDRMFHNLTGVLIMTVCLGVYMAAYFMSEKIFGKAYG